jgi:hypothetical protein
VEDVQCIFVLRGPAATAAYGTDASGGVIHILTRTPAESRQSRWFLEGGATTDVADYPANFGTCQRWRAALGACVAEVTRSFNPLKAESPFRTAPVLRAGASATFAATRRFSLGASATGQVDQGAFRNNDHSRFTLGLNGVVRPHSTVDVRADGWLLNRRTDLPQVGNFSYSILNSALLGASIDDPVRHGYRNLPLSSLEEFGIEQRSARVGGVASVRWTPRPWLSVGAIIGREDSRTRDEQADPLIAPGTGGTAVQPDPYITRGELREQASSGSAHATATFGPVTFRSTTTVQVDHIDQTHRRTTRTFDPTGELPDPSSTLTIGDRSMTGVIVRQSIASDERRYLNVGVRRDALDVSAFGGSLNLDDPTYPFANAAWDLGRELGLTNDGFVSSLRLRGAYGESGDSRAFAAVGLLVAPPGTPVPSYRVERGREIEGGMDVALLGTVSVGTTVFDKRTNDGIIQTLVPPGSGGPFQTLSNGAEWRTRGTEVDVRARLVERRAITASVALTFTSSKNEVVTLGRSPPLIGTAYRITPGYPLYGLWGQPFTVNDANSDGVIVPAEVSTVSGESRFLGSPVPTRELAVAPILTLGGSVTIAALIDHRGGFRIDNAGGRIHCNANCFALYDPDASPGEQARAVDPNDARAAWIEDGSFTRLRELSLAWTIPRSWSRRLGAQSATVAVLGRNLWTGTDYSGLDPEVSFTGQAAIVQTEFFTLPLPRTLTIRLDARW